MEKNYTDYKNCILDMGYITDEKLAETVNSVVYISCSSKEKNNCEYVAKVIKLQHENSKIMSELENEIRLQKIAQQNGLAPKILSTNKCKVNNNYFFIIIMEKFSTDFENALLGLLFMITTVESNTNMSIEIKNMIKSKFSYEPLIYVRFSK